jgi:hypothetical protein
VTTAWRRPTRRDLLVVVGRLQDLVGRAMCAHGNDRNPDGFEQGMRALQAAHELCVAARSLDDPVAYTGPWSGAAQSSRQGRRQRR